MINEHLKFSIRTNRDLYAFVGELARQYDEPPPLEDYLRSLWRLGVEHRRPVLDLALFAELLDSAFTTPPPPFDPRWASRALPVRDAPHRFRDWEHTILCQICDLHEMAADGSLANALRYFGMVVHRPRGVRGGTLPRWYNFDPLTFLECAARGTFGGWQPGDDRGCERVPGKVAVLDAPGNIITVDPQDIDDPVREIRQVSWGDFTRFLGNGQLYE